MIIKFFCFFSSVHTQENEIKRLQNQVQKLQLNLENEGTSNKHYNEMIKSLNKRCIRLEKVGIFCFSHFGHPMLNSS